MMAPKGCWTCKDRKVSCDKTIPTCLRCKKSRRECSGYGVRLTWPKEDHSRALVARARSNTSHTVPIRGTLQWINIVPTDVRLHLATNRVLREGSDRMTREQLILPNITDLRPSAPDHVATGDMELVQYFDSVVIHLLPALSIDRKKLSYLIIRSALYGSSQSSKAVYQAMLALAAYHRGDDLATVKRLKSAALRGLIIDTDPTMCQGIQHVAANLLLCVLGLQQIYNLYEHCHSDWVGYLVGSKKVLEAIKKAEHAVGSDASIVLGWVYYFDVMARFSFRHWRTEQLKSHVESLGFDPGGSKVCALQYILAQSSFIHGVPGISAHAHPVIQLVAEVSAIGLYSYAPGYFSAEYQQHLDELHLKLESVSTTPVGLEASSKVINHEQKLLELVRIAGLIYLERVSRNFSGQSSKLETWTTTALSILAQIETCLSPFALFFIGCELNNDEDRLVILNLLARMEKKAHMKSFLEVRLLIQTAWNQEDLAEGDLDYIHKLNLVMSSRDVVPSLF
ncbi:hypothetical protein HBI56_108600 [Parastagonospora nodorum]|uniref:Zn(2)-C6 fungal-type domain-containing protein n=2 Tax=Phaeosphaeria nodorum (strain SN15 / ATCC MYA-4574 / FGSC 10173) TaxID=321614 RepID=A0A7U2ETY0_PHANO|nr:hypothetical protein HBH56_041150 [Parastagonospora nodorum]QRC93026.1 hypothetical protein JI435_079240 [Parastagonospora nodorum SN15]KAH3933178.1 hypothetical protein HBH54_068900 [Parastagonospora nodorum]KAH3943547.1 hypothetical protein HBH53_173070 [Parastagonospora nodorum]KAH3961780.1 hypothetical protein HBH52_228250 [Parastagonospora nodorum]